MGFSGFHWVLVALTLLGVVAADALIAKYRSKGSNGGWLTRKLIADPAAKFHFRIGIACALLIVLYVTREYT